MQVHKWDLPVSSWDLKRLGFYWTGLTYFRNIPLGMLLRASTKDTQGVLVSSLLPGLPRWGADFWSWCRRG